jgi:hypothetical protein
MTCDGSMVFFGKGPPRTCGYLWLKLSPLNEPPEPESNAKTLCNKNELDCSGRWFMVLLGNRKCKYARFFANITGKMQIIKDYQLY